MTFKEALKKTKNLKIEHKIEYHFEDNLGESSTSISDMKLSDWNDENIHNHPNLTFENRRMQ